MDQKRGFTLLEVMLVLLLMGLAAGYVVFNVVGVNQTDRLEQQVRRFQVVFDMAADYAVLNQLQLGVRVEEEKGEYLFMILDEEDKWRLLEQTDTFQSYEIPEPFAMELTLDDLPWDTDESFFSDGVFDEELSVSDDGVEIGNEEDKPLPPPQILILSSGDITPFSLAFIYEPEFSNDLPVYFRVNGEDTTPLGLEGPLEEL